ncbi:uncharacterized protein V1510DRAFT_303969 [Dipodascopsis tothii]|uniref:uncharacterized protein n=1 Tax=Dipodascopsis tothii TaxID=44089 RepID=UPI0034CDAE5B
MRLYAAICLPQEALDRVAATFALERASAASLSRAAAICGCMPLRLYACSKSAGGSSAAGRPCHRGLSIWRASSAGSSRLALGSCVSLAATEWQPKPPYAPTSQFCSLTITIPDNQPTSPTHAEQASNQRHTTMAVPSAAPSGGAGSGGSVGNGPSVGYGTSANGASGNGTSTASATSTAAGVAGAPTPAGLSTGDYAFSTPSPQLMSPAAHSFLKYQSTAPSPPASRAAESATPAGAGAGKAERSAVCAETAYFNNLVVMQTHNGFPTFSDVNLRVFDLVEESNTTSSENDAAISLSMFAAVKGNKPLRLF